LLAAACRTVITPVHHLPAYLIDPRTGLTGPFPAGVVQGWEKMEEREWEAALRSFDASRGSASSIGRVQALLELGRFPEAEEACRTAFDQGLETVPILAACAEVAARREDWPEAYDLFEASLLRAPGSEGLLERKRATAGKAVTALLDKSRSELKTQAAEARADADRALAIAPGNLEAIILAGRASAAVGDSAAAFEHLAEAWKRSPSDVAIGEQAGNLAVKLGRGDAALEIFSALARIDSRFRGRAEESQEDFVISNWPAPEREIARAARLTRAGAVTLVWRLMPQIRTVAATAPSPVASDIIARKDQRVLSRSLQLGLLSVDPATHRARPDAFLSRADAVRLLLRAAAMTGFRHGVDCVEKAAHAKGLTGAAAGCGLLAAGKSASVTAREFRRAIAFLSAERSSR
jgi:hypothetical protein